MLPLYVGDLDEVWGHNKGQVQNFLVLWCTPRIELRIKGTNAQQEARMSPVLTHPPHAQDAHLHHLESPPTTMCLYVLEWQPGVLMFWRSPSFL